MSNNKQSSIYFLLDLLIEKGYAGVLSEDEIEQAKAMHKEEIENSYTTGFEANLYQSETYYNETFGGEQWKNIKFGVK